MTIKCPTIGHNATQNHQMIYKKNRILIFFTLQPTVWPSPWHTAVLQQVVRMYRTLLGEKGFKDGMKLYFKRHDGGAVTCDDFRAAMAGRPVYNHQPVWVTSTVPTSSCPFQNISPAVLVVQEFWSALYSAPPHYTLLYLLLLYSALLYSTLLWHIQSLGPIFRDMDIKSRNASMPVHSFREFT